MSSVGVEYDDVEHTLSPSSPRATMMDDTRAVPDPDVAAANPDYDANTPTRSASMSSGESSPPTTPGRPTLSRASSLAYSDDGGTTTPGSYRTYHSSASTSMEGIDLLGSSSAGVLPLSGKQTGPRIPFERH